MSRHELTQGVEVDGGVVTAHRARYRAAPAGRPLAGVAGRVEGDVIAALGQVAGRDVDEPRPLAGAGESDGADIGVPLLDDVERVAAEPGAKALDDVDDGP